MTTTITAIPGRYAKFITVTLGQALVYLQTYGWTWEIKPAATMAAVALAVLAVPNTPRPVAAPPAGVPPTGNVTVRPTDGITPPAGGQA